MQSHVAFLVRCHNYRENEVQKKPKRDVLEVIVSVNSISLIKYKCYIEYEIRDQCFSKRNFTKFQFF